jgi:hypothetical protein
MPGMMNNMCRGGDVARNGAKLRIALAAKIMKRVAPGAELRAQVGLYGKEVASSIAARLAPLLRLRSATSASRCGVLKLAKTGCWYQSAKPAPAARDENAPPRRHRYKRAGGVGAHPAGRDAPSTTSPHSRARLAGKNIAIRPPSE